METRSDKWREIGRQLSVNELEILFTIPYAVYVSTRDIRRLTKKQTFYKYIESFVDKRLLERESEVSNNGKKIGMYRRTFRFYRVRSDGNGKFIVEVS